MTERPICWGLFSNTFLYVDARDDFITVVRFDSKAVSASVFNIKITGINYEEV